VGKSGLVLALEPNSYVFPVLRANSELNSAKTSSCPDVRGHPEDGEFEFEYSIPLLQWRPPRRHQQMEHTHAFKLKVAGKNLQTYLASDSLPSCLAYASSKWTPKDTTTPCFLLSF